MSRVDDILDTIDAGLQHSPEASYGNDHEGQCVRDDCWQPAGEGSDFCDPCRAFMLGDSDTDPTGLAVPGSYGFSVEGTFDATPETMELLGVTPERYGPASARLAAELADAEDEYGEGAAEVLADTVGFRLRATAAQIADLAAEAEATQRQRLADPGWLIVPGSPDYPRQWPEMSEHLAPMVLPAPETAPPRVLRLGHTVIMVLYRFDLQHRLIGSPWAFTPMGLRGPVDAVTDSAHTEPPGHTVTVRRGNVTETWPGLYPERTERPAGLRTLVRVAYRQVEFEADGAWVRWTAPWTG
ncbi:MAG: hypothetical protein ACRBK7_14400 [Acidimicrobiales bacterium]